MPSLTVAYLTRNEDEDLGRSLRSVAGIADQVLVVDTDSTDRTVEVAREAGAEIGQFAWDDDFAAGRNAVVRQAMGDWILWLNADEELLAPDRAALSTLLEDPAAFGYWVTVQYPDPGGPPSETLDVRLFRNRPDLEFQGRLHPRFAPALVEHIRAEGLQVRPSPLVLLNHSPAGPKPVAKLKFIERLLERELEDRPDQLHYLIEHGRTLLLLGDPRGHQVMARALDQVLAVFGQPTAPSAKVQVLLEYLLALPPGSVRPRLGREGARELARRWFPESPQLVWIEAGHHFERGDHRQAAECLERLVRMGRTGRYDRTARFDPRIIGEQAVLNLGACYLALGALDAAESCFQAVAESPTLGAGARQNLGLVAQHRMAAEQSSPRGR